MNLELNGHKITLGPKALAFVETAYRAKGEYLDQCAAIYCRDQLELWRAGGKVDPDVTIEGPARFAAKGNEIGLPKKAGAEARERGSIGPGSAEPLPVASAAPADLYEPKGTHAIVGDTVDLYSRRFKVTEATDFDFMTNEHAGVVYRVLQGGTAYRILKRQAPPAHGLQVWQAGSLLTVYGADGKTLAVRYYDGKWSRHKGFARHGSETRLASPEADAAIKEARAQGVL